MFFEQELGRNTGNYYGSRRDQILERPAKIQSLLQVERGVCLQKVQGPSVTLLSPSPAGADLRGNMGLTARG